MEEQHFPAVYRSANELSKKSQSAFFRALKLHLILLIIGSALSVFNFSHWISAVLQAIVFFGAFSCSVYLFAKRPDKDWYAGRAVAESIKTITWRYICRAEPFQGDDESARTNFRHKVQAVVDQNKDVVKAHLDFVGNPQLTQMMAIIRAKSLEERKAEYALGRINDQLEWYANKARLNQKSSNIFFWILIMVNAIAVVLSLIRIAFVAVPFWPTDIFIAVAASLLGWMQARRFSDLAAAYGLAAYEIGLIKEQCMIPQSESEFSSFVGDAENAFSREHTQWVARKDL